MAISIRDYNKDSSSDMEAFKRITNQWILPLIEDEDIRIMNDPYGVIVKEKKGNLFVAEEACENDGAVAESKVVGVVGIVEVSEGIYEMVKLGVDTSVQGKGIGRKLIVKCIERTKELKATKLELETHSSLQAAVRLYESLGFVKLNVPTHFVTADTKMELFL